MQQEKHSTLCTEATKNVVDKTTKQKALCTKVQGAFLIILNLFVIHYRSRYRIQKKIHQHSIARNAE